MPRYETRGVISDEVISVAKRSMPAGTLPLAKRSTIARKPAGKAKISAALLARHEMHRLDVERGRRLLEADRSAATATLGASVVARHEANRRLALGIK